jgi:hypothetical protein
MKDFNHADSIKCQHINHKYKCYGENIYNKVGNEKRLALLDMVKLKGRSLKEAASKLDINYSTAKTILRVYRIENRILKKTPCQSRSKKLFATHCDEEEDEDIDIEEKFDLKEDDTNKLIAKDTIFKVISGSNLSRCSKSTPASSFLDDRNTQPNNSGNNFFPQNSHDTDSTQNPEELYKSTEEFLIQFKSIVGTLQFCMNEVARNEITIKNICAMLGINHVGNISSFFNNPFVHNALKGNLGNMNTLNRLTGVNNLNSVKGINNSNEGVVHKPIPITYSGNNFLTMNTTLLNK